MKQGGAEDLFPRGLAQPEAGFRFSVDSLLLSVFLVPGNNWKVLDLGCGCGVVGLGLILANPGKEIQVTGVDNDPEMIECARQNSRALCLEEKSSYRLLDVTSLDSQSLAPESFDLVLANPPYRDERSGRTPENPGKKSAQFVTKNSQLDFFQAAFFALKNRAAAGFVYPASRLDQLLLNLDRSRLRPKTILPVYGRAGKQASLVLVKARKNSGPELSMLPPLILYDEHNSLTQQAREFCPFLECNQGRE
ncbi:Methyltransferase type 11 [Desulfonatronospira thiodismutans ASO3-1]|uniref:Methyltransferase type 11 n=1 Tax=Desulfonatronospira thiodismutans ASO3-1 TaxID=555779 RepID=D6SSJ4_9BACT|nr:methyltransferase [Desulfonatronospira thiodismutans]EFI33660.1 Methyltransferase type 11 [Desulfonatronospira thiodismutans ASO3-1]